MFRWQILLPLHPATCKYPKQQVSAACPRAHFGWDEQSWAAYPPFLTASASRQFTSTQVHLRYHYLAPHLPQHTTPCGKCPTIHRTCPLRNGPNWLGRLVSQAAAEHTKTQAVTARAAPMRPLQSPYLHSGHDGWAQRVGSLILLPLPAPPHTRQKQHRINKHGNAHLVPALARTRGVELKLIVNHGL